MFCDRQRADFARCRRLNGSSGSDDVICVSLLNDHIQSQGSTAAGQRKLSFDLVTRKLVEIVLERTMASGKSDEFPL